MVLMLTRSCMQTSADLGRPRQIYDAMRVARLAANMQVPRNKIRCPNPPPLFRWLWVVPQPSGTSTVWATCRGTSRPT